MYICEQVSELLWLDDGFKKVAFCKSIAECYWFSIIFGNIAVQLENKRFFRLVGTERIIYRIFVILRQRGKLFYVLVGRFEKLIVTCREVSIEGHLCEETINVAYFSLALQENRTHALPPFISIYEVLLDFSLRLFQFTICEHFLKVLFYVFLRD